MKIDSEQLTAVLSLLNERLGIAECPHIGLVVCGGSALIATKLICRTTKDVDIVARVENDTLIDPSPLPEALVKEAKFVADNYNLPADWLNCGPSDLFRMGLPDGCTERLIETKFGDQLTIYFISRLDQIYFKLYASVDRGGYHIDDLLNLNPTSAELIQASQWSMTHDVSDGYKMMLKQLLNQLGYSDVADQL